jgi:TPR repeat protein
MTRLKTLYYYINIIKVASPALFLAISITGAIAQSAQNLETQCSAANAESCFLLGRLHDEGKNASKNKQRALDLYAKSCDGGHTKGCTALALSEEDPSKAAALYTKACDGGDMWGCNNLGLKYGEGKGVPMDDEKAVQLLKKSCDGQFFLGCSNLADYYDSGKGVGQNKRIAEQLKRQACDAGVRIGCKYFKRGEAEVSCLKIANTRNMDSYLRVNIIEEFGIKNATNISLAQSIIESNFRTGRNAISSCVETLLLFY